MSKIKNPTIPRTGARAGAAAICRRTDQWPPNQNRIPKPTAVNCGNGSAALVDFGAGRRIERGPADDCRGFGGRSAGRQIPRVPNVPDGGRGGGALWNGGPVQGRRRAAAATVGFNRGIGPVEKSASGQNGIGGGRFARDVDTRGNGPFDLGQFRYGGAGKIHFATVHGGAAGYRVGIGARGGNRIARVGPRRAFGVERI